MSTPQMDERYATSPDQVPLMDTADLRERFLVEEMFVPGQVRATYTHHDRIVVAGILPAGQDVVLPTYAQLRTETFFANREAGIVNIGETGTITVDGETYELGNGSALYIGRGAGEVVLTGQDAAFYLFSAPAHTAHPTTLVTPEQANTLELGDITTSNRRTIRQLIHAGGVQSCQVVMGFTTLHEGSMWTTMPAHTHDRRTEVYLYYGLSADARVVHIMGEPTESRHLMVADRQAVISPSWSLHTGVGTAAYTFIWAMAGENKDYTDMDTCQVTEIL